jgi:hypothetical protein
MTEALSDDYFGQPSEGELENTAPIRPALEVVDEPRPAFVRSTDDIAWWNALPSWRRELYLLPKFETEEERIRAITQQLGMSVVSYAGGTIRRYTP